ncbi:MAG: hypothetical protein QM496_11620 [Verrucomicrobiota bacterium]
MIQQSNNAPYRDLPTTSLYLQDCLNTEGLCSDWENCRAGPFSFRFDDRLLIIRYATDAEVDLARTIRAEGGRVIYLIDDDLGAIVNDLQLPEDYRGRIEGFVSGLWQELKELIDEVVVSSNALLEKMQCYEFEMVTQLDPLWSIPSDTIQRPSNHQSPLKIAWLCSRSHIADLESISAELVDFFSRHQDVRLTVLFGKNRPTWIKRLHQVENINPMSWNEYRSWVGSRQFDLALYPLLDSEVNQSRSINKFLEHAVVGAASIISTNAPFADRLQLGDCFFAQPGEWIDCLEMLMADRSRILEMANQARRRALIISEKAQIQQIEFWKKRLPLVKAGSSTSGVRV